MRLRPNSGTEHDKRTKQVSRLTRALRRSSVSQRLNVTACNSHTQLTNLQYVYDCVSFNPSVVLKRLL